MGADKKVDQLASSGTLQSRVCPWQGSACDFVLHPLVEYFEYYVMKRYICCTKSYTTASTWCKSVSRHYFSESSISPRAPNR